MKFADEFRDRDKAKALLEESHALQQEVVQRFDEMRERYRGAHEWLTSREAWGEVFED